MNLYFLQLQDVLTIHEFQINKYGGSMGIRDKFLLISAIAQPQGMFGGQYLHESIFEKAAAYLYYICKNHPFIDGNKRVSLASSLMFFALNNYSFNYNGKDLEKLVLEVAAGKLHKDAVANFFEKNI